MLFTDAAGRQVVSTSTAETVGQIAEFVIDPQSHAVVAVTLKKASSGDTVLWSSITAFGVDAVTVTGPEAVIDAQDADAAVVALSSKDRRLLGKRVLNTLGEDLGPVTDVDFDPDTGGSDRTCAGNRQRLGRPLDGDRVVRRDCARRHVAVRLPWAVPCTPCIRWGSATRWEWCASGVHHTCVRAAPRFELVVVSIFTSLLPSTHDRS